MTIAIVIGTNAELIKTVPVMKELSRRRIRYVFISTGQHKMEHTCKLFRVRKPDAELTKPPEKSSKFFTKALKAIFWNFFIVPLIWLELRQIKDLRYVLYHGDTMSAASTAIASSRLLNPWKRYQNVHLEAGLRSGSIWEPFPEELSRKICDRFSDVLFAVSEGTVRNLRKEKLKGQVVQIGNTVIDAVHLALSLKPKVEIPKGDYCVVNSHRHENLTSRERMGKIVTIIESAGVPVIWPLHDNTRQKLEEYGLMGRLEKNPNISITPLVTYADFAHLLKNCKYILTDGGSIQEESLELRKPCILLRNYTERDEGLATGINFLTHLDVTYARRLIMKIESGELQTKDFKNPYGQKGVSKKAVDYLVGR